MPFPDTRNQEPETEHVPTGTVFDVKRFAVHDGPGIRTTVFLKGCPLACPWCHNPESRSPDPETFPVGGEQLQVRSRTWWTGALIGREVTVDEVISEVRRDRIYYEESGGGVTFSGGEPFFQPEFLCALLRACREEGLRTAIDTTGFAPWETIAKTVNLTDLYLFDLKLMDPVSHRRHTGADHGTIHTNLLKLLDLGLSVTIRIPLITGVTDTADNLAALSAFISRCEGINGVDLLPYNPVASSKYHRLGLSTFPHDAKTQSEEELESIRLTFSNLKCPVSIGG